MNRSTFLLLFILGFHAMHVPAQTVAGTDTTTKKPWFLTLGIDQKMRSISGTYKYFYEGEYNVNDNLWDEPQWTWKQRERKETDLLEWSHFFSTKIDMLISRNHNWKGGLSYNFGALVYEDTLFNYQNLSFIAITGLGEYTHYFKEKVQGSPFAYGSIALGFYRETEMNGGPGRELFGESRVGIGYHNKKDWMFRAWVATNYLHYREHSVSPVFNKDQVRKIDINLAYWGFGLFRQFHLVPE